MISNKMKTMVSNSSVIRAMFEEGKDFQKFMVKKMFLIIA